MTFTPACKSCGLHGDAGCYLRFAKSTHPQYRYEKRQAGLGMTDWCIGITPAPRPVKKPDLESCPDWRDPSGNSAEDVRQAMAAGEYKR